jgi:hypothetical protein
VSRLDRDRWFRHKYNMPLSEVERLFSECSRKCRICQRDMTLDGQASNRAVLDHCFQTKKIRGLICDRCNRGLGCFGDSIDTLINAVVYLKTSKESKPLGFVNTRNRNGSRRVCKHSL